MKKWLIPATALVVISIIALITWRFVLKPTDAGSYTFYMILPGGNGSRGAKIGCGDSLVAIHNQTVSDTRISDVYEHVVDLHEYTYQQDTSLRNPLYQSHLQVASALIDQNGIARVDLTGTLSLSGDCDAPRVKALLEKPAYQFDGVKGVEVRVNDVDLATALKQ